MTPGTTVLEFRTLKKTSRFGAKVRTGCQTCKARRIKCDEQKPECARCVNSGRTCGYTHNVANTVPHAPIVRRNTNLRSPSSTISDLGDNIVYLEFYHHCAGISIASSFDRDFWSRIVLQLTQSEPAVRHAVTALGYLTRTENGSLKHARSSSTTESRKPLLVQYNKAVRSLVERMSEPSYSVEIGLVTCLLFICIECLRGDYPAAFVHLHSGLKVIAQTELASPTSQTQNVVNLGMIRNKLAPIFTRAITNGLLFGAPFEPVLDSHCPRPLVHSKHSFGTVLEAQTVLFELRNATVILISILYRKIIGGAMLDSDDIEYRFHLLCCHDHWFRSLQNLESEGSLSSEEKVVCSSLKVSHYCTHIALACALDIDQTVFDSHLEGVKALNHHAKIVLDSMELPGSSSPRSMAPSDSPSSSYGSDASAPSLNGSRSSVAHFTFDLAVIAPLYFAATRCRCPTTRRESLSLLERNPPREALWDAEQHAVVVRRTIEIEESEIDPITGWPVQRTRLGPTIIREMDASGGFWVGFRSIAWMLGGQHPTRILDGGSITGQAAEWEEWFQM